MNAPKQYCAFQKRDIHNNIDKPSQFFSVLCVPSQHLLFLILLFVLLYSPVFITVCLNAKSFQHFADVLEAIFFLLCAFYKSMIDRILEY